MKKATLGWLFFMLEARAFLCFLWPFLPFFLVSINLSMLKEAFAVTLLRLVADTGAAWAGMETTAKTVEIAIRKDFMGFASSK